MSTNNVDKVVASYLRKRGYHQAESALRNEATQELEDFAFEVVDPFPPFPPFPNG